MSAKRGRASTTCTPASNAVSCRRHVSFCSCRLCQSVDVVGETLEGFGSGLGSVECIPVVEVAENS